MTRPIPIFRFVFAAYYTTSNKWEHDDEGAFEKAARDPKSEFPALALVVNNDDGATAQNILWPCERACEYKAE